METYTVDDVCWLMRQRYPFMKHVTVLKVMADCGFFTKPNYAVDGTLMTYGELKLDPSKGYVTATVASNNRKVLRVTEYGFKVVNEIIKMQEDTIDAKHKYLFEVEDGHAFQGMSYRFREDRLKEFFDKQFFQWSRNQHEAEIMKDVLIRAVNKAFSDVTEYHNKKSN